VKNIAIFALLSMLVVLLYKYHSTLNYLDIIRNKIDNEDMMLYKESDEIFSVIGKDNSLNILFKHNSYGINSFSVIDKLSGKQIYFNFSEEGNLSCYQYNDSKYAVTTNVYLQSYRDNFVERVETLNGYETFYKFLKDGNTKITVKDTESVQP
jgi:hypothetical protein